MPPRLTNTEWDRKAPSLRWNACIAGGVDTSMMHSRRTAIHRLKVLPQIAALLLSVGLGFQASLCPPGMDMGMDMDKEMSMPAGALSPATVDSAVGHQAGLHCVFAASNNEDGQATCPFALNGSGPCGTTVSASAAVICMPLRVASSQFSLVSNPSGHTDPFRQVNLPPPRA